MSLALMPLDAGAQTVSLPAVTQPDVERRRLSPEQVTGVAPALEAYTQGVLYGELWRRPGLSRRDRSLVTVAAMITRGEAPALTYHADQAIANGVTPAELSETITHLAFYAGWPDVFSALPVFRKAFADRMRKAR